VTQQKAVIEGKDLGKVEALTIEFNYLLAAQLESQRQYFEEIISSLKSEKDVEIDELRRNLESIQRERSLLASKNERMSNDVSSLEKQKTQCQAKLTKAQEELHALREEAAFLRQVSFLFLFSPTRCLFVGCRTKLTIGDWRLAIDDQQINEQLTQYKSQWDSKLKTVSEKSQQQEDAANEKIQELEGQVHDLMLHIQALETIQSASEVSEGQVIVLPSSTSPSSASSSSSSSSSSPSRLGGGGSGKKRPKRK